MNSLLSVLNVLFPVRKCSHRTALVLECSSGGGGVAVEVVTRTCSGEPNVVFAKKAFDSRFFYDLGMNGCSSEKQ